MPSQSTSRTRRVLFEDDPREADYLRMYEEVKAIRSGLGDLRGRLQALGREETSFWFDSIANDAAGALSTAVMALYSLMEGRHDLRARAIRSRELWADVEANPEDYLIRPGTARGRTVARDADPDQSERRSGADLIAAERERQVTDENWTSEHDDHHNRGELAKAAGVYSMPFNGSWKGREWPFPEPFKHADPTWEGRIRELVKAGALIAAEIDRLQRRAS